MESKAINLASFCDEGIPSAENFEIVTTTVDVSNLQEGEFIFKLLVISPDPYMRGRMKSSHPAGSKPGKALQGFVAGEVILSASADFPVGALLGASLPFQTVQRLSKTLLATTTIAWNLQPFLSREDISLGVGIFGMPGATVYGGLLSVLKPKSGETLFVSGAAGAVGSLVGSIAKNVIGCRVVGSCGGPEKAKFLTEQLKFDAAVDYKQASNTAELKALLKVAAPDGVDMYFDNVGGMHFEAAFESLRNGGRMAICGGISQYNTAQAPGVMFDPMKMIYSCQRIEGFLSTPYLREGAFLPKMREWLDAGKIARPDETVFKGVDAWAEAFKSLFTGANTGKVVLML